MVKYAPAATHRNKLHDNLYNINLYVFYFANVFYLLSLFVFIFEFLASVLALSTHRQHKLRDDDKGAFRVYLYRRYCTASHLCNAAQYLSRQAGGCPIPV